MSDVINTGINQKNSYFVSEEEYAAKKKSEREAVYRMIDTAATEVVSTPERFTDFLDTAARLSRYSTANILLIHKQEPNATRLKEFRDWSDENVRIKRGARSIRIFEPYEYTREDGSTGISYNVKKMFDISQTDAKRMPAPNLNSNINNITAVMLDTSPVKAQIVDNLPQGITGAFYDNEKQTIFVQRNTGNNVLLFQSIAKELAHAEISMSSGAYSRERAEFDAHCIAYMICSKYGVDTKDFRIKSLTESLSGKESTDIRKKLEGIRDGYNEINDRISSELYRRRSQEKDNPAR